MLRTLNIRDFVIVDHLELDFAPGFTVLTGETGAGKSILIDALGLCLGGRADPSMVREGASKAEICAEFQVDQLVRTWLQEQDMAENQDHVIIRRTIDQNGRSKNWINGSVCTTAQLRELGEQLVDIHGQHAHQSLLKPDAQRRLLDEHGRNLELSHAVRLAFQQWKKLAQQLESFENNAKSMMQERERLEWQVNELDKLQLKEGEWDALCQEQSRLAHAASLLEGAQQSVNALNEADHPILSQVRAIQQRISKLAQVDVDLNPIVESLDQAVIQLQESVYGLNDYLSRTEIDPARLIEVDQRVDALHSAARRLHVAPEKLPEEYQQLAQQLENLAALSDPEQLRSDLAQAKSAYDLIAQRLSTARQSAAQDLASRVTQVMQDLSLAGGRFEIQLNPVEASSYGYENVEFMVAGHAGVTPRALAKVASGGELARISLAISVITSSAAMTPTLIFDEVDSGIGGGVAEVVGRLLKKLGQERQVLCVTHLPQVASQGHAHFRVSKTQDQGKTLSRIDVLSNSERVEEIARMLGGIEITATTRKHARELLA